MSPTGYARNMNRSHQHERLFSTLLFGAAAFGVSCGLAAIMPKAWLFGLLLMFVGISAQTFTTTVNSTIQLSTEPAMRGRVMAILLAIAVGGTPARGPIIGWVADRFRTALGTSSIAAASGIAAAGSGDLLPSPRYRHLRHTEDQKAVFASL